MPSHPPAEAAIKFQTWVCFLSCVRPITEKNGMSRDTVLLCDWPYTGKNIGPMFETLLPKCGSQSGGVGHSFSAHSFKSFAGIPSIPAAESADISFVAFFISTLVIFNSQKRIIVKVFVKQAYLVVTIDECIDSHFEI